MIQEKALERMFGILPRKSGHGGEDGIGIELSALDSAFPLVTINVFGK